MLTEFEQVPYTQMTKEKPEATTTIYLNPAYIVSINSRQGKDRWGRDISHITMASRGDPEEGSDYYNVLGGARDLWKIVNIDHSRTL